MNCFKRTGILFFSAVVWLTTEAQQFKISEKINEGATAFSLNDVRLLPSPFKHAMDKDAAWLLEIVPDRLLHRFRLYAGLKPKGEVYGGWESMGISGHSLGHYLSACAIMYAASGDKRFKQRVDYIINELAECQKQRKTGYVGAIPREDSIFNEVAAGDIRSRGFDLNGGWVPWYTVHKVMAGIFDAYSYAGNMQALEINKKMSDWVVNKFKNLSEEQFQLMLRCEHGGMNEVLADMYAVTGKKEYLVFSYKFYHKAVLLPLSEQKDMLAGLHANTQIPKVIGCARLYELTGNIKDSTIANYFWKEVVDHHSYVTGGNSEHEHFGKPDQLAERLSNATTETCNTYNMLKLTRHLFAWKPDAVYMNYYERALYNHILASQNPDDGMTCYFVSLKPGTPKTYGTPFESFWCCTGTGMENHVKYGESIYFKESNGGLYVNLFIPSVLKWKEKKVQLKMETKFPAEEMVKLSIETAPSNSSFTIYIRKPVWLAGEMSFKVNDNSINANSLSNGYFAITRIWKQSDVLQWDMPMGIYNEAMPDNENRLAFLYGPLLLAGAAEKESIKNAIDIPVLVTNNKDINGLIKNTSANDLLFSVKTNKDGFPLKPFYTIHDSIQQIVYWDRFTENQWQEKKKQYEAELKRVQELEARTLDILRTGEMQPERDHNLRGENTTSGDALGRKWRHAQDGWFEFDMKAEDSSLLQLVCTYWGGETGKREFHILVEGEIIAFQQLHQDKPNEFFDRYYDIPSYLIIGKKKITIRFQSLPGAFAGGLYGCRLIKKQ